MPASSAPCRHHGDGHSPYPSVSPNSFGTSHSLPTYAPATTTAVRGRPSPRLRAACHATAVARHCGCSHGANTASTASPVPGGAWAYASIAGPNQPNTTSSKAIAASTPNPSACRTLRRRSSAASHGTSTIQPSRCQGASKRA